MSNDKHGCSFMGPGDAAGGSCCREHDRAYAKGEFIAKIVADFALLFCIIKTAPKSNHWYTAVFSYLWRIILAIIMFVAVFTVGWLWWSKYLLRRLFGWFAKKDD